MRCLAAKKFCSLSRLYLSLGDTLSLSPPRLRWRQRARRGRVGGLVSRGVCELLCSARWRGGVQVSKKGQKYKMGESATNKNAWRVRETTPKKRPVCDARARAEAEKTRRGFEKTRLSALGACAHALLEKLRAGEACVHAYACAAAAAVKTTADADCLPRRAALARRAHALWPCGREGGKPFGGKGGEECVAPSPVQ